MREHQKHKNAFTLIELLIVVAMIAILSGTLWLTLIYYERRAHSYQLQQDMHAQARFAIQAIIKDIANSSDVVNAVATWQQNKNILILKLADPESTRAEFVIYEAKNDMLLRHILRNQEEDYTTHSTKIIGQNLKDFSYSLSQKLIDFQLTLAFDWQQRHFEAKFASAANLQ
ncbi:MAG: prepilin-type N-terminal cleavage/methylation domain-containing protein [Candidatus Sumerlaeia bacterium]|nr:prepilin-type N-terminal cleavage/methylation domain-containing protein [Candidatus Sumerlaeia bacterium]